MAFKREVLKLAPTGLNFDLPVDSVPIESFNQGLNIQFRDGIATRSMGYAGVYPTPIDPPEYLMNVRTELVNYWLYPCQDVIGVLDGSAHYDVSPVVPLVPTTTQNQWTGDVMNGIPVVNNDLNPPIYWPLDVLTECAPLPDWPAATYCKAMRSYKYHLIAMNIRDASGSYGDLILWSDAAEPGAVPDSWTPAADNEAGSATLADTPGDIVDGYALRDMFVIFKPTSMYALTYIGGNDVFAIRKINDASGMLTRNCAANMHGITVVLTGNDVVLIDGNSIRSISDKRVRRAIFAFIDPINYVNSYVVADQTKSEIWVCVPSTGNITPDYALVWSMDSDAWGIRTIPNPSFIAPGIVAENATIPTWDSTPFTWETVPGIWDSSNYNTASETLLMAAGGDLFSIDATVDNDGDAVVASLIKDGIDMGVPQYFKLLKKVWPRISAATGTVVRISVGAHNTPTDPIEWSPAVDFIVGTSKNVACFANGRYLAVQFNSDTLPVWKLTGFDLEYSLGGLE